MIEVQYVDHMGCDRDVAREARVSFGEPTNKTEEEDHGLIKYLARGMTTGDYKELIRKACITQSLEEMEALLWSFRKTPTHHSPFNHVALKTKVTAPVFVARQLFKTKFLVCNEVSRRYVDGEPTYYKPENWRKTAKDIKQGSWYDSNDSIFQDDLHDLTSSVYYDVNGNSLYHELLDLGLCPEQARGYLSQNMMTTWVWTGFLGAWCDMLNTRLRSDTQEETRQVANQVLEIAKDKFPVCVGALVEGRV